MSGYLLVLHGGSFLSSKMEWLFYSTSYIVVYSGYTVEHKPHSYVSNMGGWRWFFIHCLSWLQLSVTLLCVFSERTPWPLTFCVTRKDLAKLCDICCSFLDVQSTLLTFYRPMDTAWSCVLVGRAFSLCPLHGTKKETINILKSWLKDREVHLWW